MKSLKMHMWAVVKLKKLIQRCEVDVDQECKMTAEALKT